MLIVSALPYAQTETNSKPAEAGAKPAEARLDRDTPAVAITATTAPIDLARAALAAQGGEKFKTLKNMVLRGSVDLYAPNSTQSVPGGFVWVIAGDKIPLEVDARPIFSFKQIL